MRVPRGPLAETFFCQEPPLSFPPIGSSSSIYSRLESISGVLVLQFPILPMEIHLGYFEPYRNEFTEMHSEGRYCLWAMIVSLSVYMELLCLVDIDVRQDISDTVGNFLAGWKGGRTHALTDSLDELIISQFNLHSITRVPDMVRLQKEKHCNSISSTVAAYIRDLAINIDNMSQGDLDGAIQFLFPFSEKFIGRCFSPGWQWLPQGCWILSSWIRAKTLTPSTQTAQRNRRSQAHRSYRTSEISPLCLDLVQALCQVIH